MLIHFLKKDVPTFPEKMFLQLLLKNVDKILAKHFFKQLKMLNVLLLVGYYWQAVLVGEVIYIVIA
jgi:hypothetical protein